MTAETQYIKDEQMFKCRTQNYFVSQKICDNRQDRGHKACKKCTLARGKINDPRGRE